MDKCWKEKGDVRWCEGDDGRGGSGNKLACNALNQKNIKSRAFGSSKRAGAVAAVNDVRWDPN